MKFFSSASMQDALDDVRVMLDWYCNARLGGPQVFRMTFY